VFVDQCSVEDCDKDAVDTHHEKQQQTADEQGNVGHFHKNRKHNLIPLCKQHHNLADKQLLNFEYKMTSDGVKLFCVTNDDK
jgi:DNA mismatch repair protein MutS